ncbi:MAG: NYN domain-containing protein [Phycisphaerae bacterium]|nr:NYN domain-containing protein [Phycisphaerae bacterium]
MIKTVAILLDAGFVKVRLKNLLGGKLPEAKDIYSFAQACAAEDEEIFRIYYYDCPPYQQPIYSQKDKRRILFIPSAEIIDREAAIQRKLSLMDLVAYRAGELSYSGWKLKKDVQAKLLDHSQAQATVDFGSLMPDFKQKRVDMKIGLDVAWLSSKGIVKRIILVTGDSDFVPAMKFARREGIQVVLVPMGSKLIKEALRVHADYVRNVPFPPPEQHA